MKNLVIGRGEVGIALANVLECDLRDIEPHDGQYDTIHIAFGWHEGFEDSVLGYVAEHGARLVVVHSTVPVGTCDAHDWVHSPVRGKHPDLYTSVLTFVKHFGGPRALEAVRSFMDQNVPCTIHDKASTTELGKLVELAQYGAEVSMNKAIYSLCERYDVPFTEVYSEMSDEYNRGYRSLGDRKFTKPILDYVEGPIGGHCVSPGIEMLGSDWFISATEGLRSSDRSVGIPS